MGSLREADFAGALRQVGEKAKASLSEDSLRESWEKISREAGNCGGIEKVGTTMGPGFTVVSVRCKTDRFMARGLAIATRPSAAPRSFATLRLAIAMLRKLPSIDKTKIFVVGHGEGGRLAPQLAKEDPTLAGLVIAAASVKTATAGLPPTYARSLRKYGAEELARKAKMPILIVAGDRDAECTAADFRKWKNTLKGSRRAETKWLPGLNHLFVSGTGSDDNGKPANVAPELIEAIARFVTK